jgi:hypothetical protein
MIFFLDIDGVFNLDWSGTWDDKSMAYFNLLTGTLKAKAVVSSTWRAQYNIEQLQKIFEKQGVNIEINDYTPIINQGDRGEEISQWLDDNDYDGYYLIIDDKIKDIEGYFSDCFIINCKDNLGITEDLCIEAAHKVVEQKSLM